MEPPVSAADVLARLGQAHPWEGDEEAKSDIPRGATLALNADRDQFASKSEFASNSGQSHLDGQASPSLGFEQPPLPGGGREEEQAMEEYMNQLLARVRGQDSSAQETPDSDVPADRPPITEQS